MSEIQIPSGSALKLELLLRDGNATKFPVAHVYDSTGTAIVGSPFTLAHSALGNYRAATPPSPADGKYTALYITYNEVGHTTEAPYKRTSESQDVNPKTADIAAILVDTGTTIPATLATQETKAEADARQVLLIAEHDATQATLATQETKAQADARQALLIAEHDATQAAIAALNDPTALAIADAVWDELRAAHTVLGSFGEALDATVSSRSTQASVDIIDANVDAILVDTGTDIPATLATIETKAQADTRQLALIAEHDATQAAISALNDPTALAIADAVWDELLAGHTTAGSAGKALSDASVGADPASVWDVIRSAHTAVGSFGEAAQGVLSTTRADNLDNLDVAISDLETKAQADIRQAALVAEHDTTQSAIAGLNDPTALAIADAVWDELLSAHVAAGSMGANQNLIDDILADTGTTIPATLATIETKTQADARQVLLIAEHDTTQAAIAALNDLDAATIADAVWDELLAGHIVADSAGKTLSDLSLTAGSPDAIADAVWDELRSGHTIVGSFGEALDVKVSTRASQASVDGIQNTTRFQGIVPPVLVKDLAASKDYKFYVRLSNIDGAPEDPDLNIMNLRIEDSAGGIVVGTVGMTRTGTGQYEYIFTVLPADIERPLIVFFEYDENAVSFQQVRTTEIAENEGKLDTLLGRLTQPRADNLDNLDATITSRESEADAAARQVIDVAEHDQTQLDIAAVKADTSQIRGQTDLLVITGGNVHSQVEVNNDKTGYTLTTGEQDIIVDKVWDEARIGHTTPGTFGLYLDDQVSLKEDESDAAARAAADIAEHDATQATLATVDGKVDIIDANVDAILVDTSTTIPAQITALNDPTAAAIADAVWDEPNADHLIAGSTGLNLSNAGGAASPSTIADAVWDELRGGHTAAGSYGEALQGVLSTTRANNLDNLDATVSSRATQASVDAIQNSTRFVGIVQSPMILPVSGSKDYKYFVRLYDTAGLPQDPDANSMKIRIEETGGVVVIATTAMTRTDVGQYEFVYTVNSTDTEQPLNVFFEYDENAVAFQQVRTTEVVEFESKLDTLLARLTQTRADNLDNLDVAISTRQSEIDALARFNSLVAEHDTTQVDIASVAAQVTAVDGKVDILDTNVDAVKVKTDQMNFNGANILAEAAVVSDKVDYALSSASLAALADGVWDELLAGHTTIGSTGEAMARVDVDVSSRASAADLATVAAQVDRLDTDYTTARAGNLDNLDVAISTRATQASVDALPTSAAIVDGVWDEAIAGHLTAGSTGKALSDSGLGTSPAAIADAVWDELLAGHIVSGSFGEALDTPISTRATQASVDSIPTNPVLVNDPRLDNLDVPVSSVSGGGSGGEIVPELVGEIANSDELSGTAGD